MRHNPQATTGAGTSPPLTSTSLGVPFLRDTVYYNTFAGAPAARDQCIFFCIDHKLVYEGFYSDFGPHNLGATFQFCEAMNALVATARRSRCRVIFYSSPDPQMRANAVTLLCCWGVLFCGLTATQAFAPFADQVLSSFLDASPFVARTCTKLRSSSSSHLSSGGNAFRLGVADCVHGLERALQAGYISPSTFNLRAYRHYEQVEHGDLTWISPKLLAFAGPHPEYSATDDGYVNLPPEHFIPIFKKENVTLVVQLNHAGYDASRFTRHGLAHLDLYYPDGSNPPRHILQRFLTACQRTPGAVAVHCKAGLGRTGTCIAAYLMQQDRFSAAEAIGWLRLCRPGSVIGAQQDYLVTIQEWMWQTGADAVTKNAHDDGSTPMATVQAIASARSDLVTSLASTVELDGAMHRKRCLGEAIAEGTQGDHLRRLKHKCQQHYVR